MPKLSPRAVKIAGLALLPAVLSPVLGRAMPGLYSNFRAQMLCFAVVYVIGALALNVLMGYAGQVSLGHAAFIGVGTYTAGIIAGTHAQPMILDVIAAAALGALFAVIVGLPALRLKGLYLGISTLAFLIAMQKFVFASAVVGGGAGGKGIPLPKIGTFEVELKADYFVIAWIALIVVWLVDRNLTGSKVGRAMRALKTDEDVAASFGIDAGAYKLVAFALCGAFAGVAGSLYGHLLTIADSRQFTFEFSLAWVIMVVVGGLGSRLGVAISAAAFAILPRTLGAVPAFSGFPEIMGALLLIFTVARHPGGLAQAMLEARERKRIKAGEMDEGVLLTLPTLPGASEPARVTQGTMLEVRDVSVRFGGLQALDNASITVPAGEIVGLIGPNGAGKSTLFNVISGFVKPDSGSIAFQGRSIESMPPHDRAALGLARSFQLIGLAKDRSVLENFLIAQHLHAGYDTARALLGTPKVRAAERRLRQRAHEAIELLGFESFAERSVGTLSHGQQRLVELGCALVTSPDLLLLDEPSAGMSPAAAEALAQRLRLIRDELGRTVLLIEHHIPMVLATCDELYVLTSGRVLAHGTPSEIVTNAEVVTAYLGEDVA